MKKPPEKGAKKKASEPIFGSGAPQAIAYALSWIVTFILIALLTRR
jgi:hypothetical protein